MASKPVIELISDNAILIKYPAAIDEQINHSIHRFAERLSKHIIRNGIEGILDITPTYHTVQVTYDVLILEPETLIQEIQDQLFDAGLESENEMHVVEIPVCYELPYALDLEAVCAFHGISADELVKRHTAADYLIYMMGFTPGFPYLGGMDESIAIPRKNEPRLKIPAGSVGIAGPQTGIYPVESPGGWQIIGRTPLKLFDSSSENPFLLSAGDYIRFRPITKDEFDIIREGTWED